MNSGKQEKKKTNKIEIAILVDEETYWRLKDYMNKLRIRRMSELFRKYLIPCMEKLIEQYIINSSTDTRTESTQKVSISPIIATTNKNEEPVNDTAKQDTSIKLDTNIQLDKSNINIPDSETFIDLVESMNRNRDFLSREMLISMFKSRNINALSEEQYEYLIEEIPKLKEYFVKEGEYYKIKGLDNK